MTSNNNPTATAAVLILATVAIIIGGLRVLKHRGSDLPVPQLSSTADTRASYIAQTALDRSVKALVANPQWRDGFDGIPFASGTYDVRVYGADSSSAGGPSIPPNYVRIVASSEIDGVRKSVEALWVNAMSAFYYTYAAGDQIDIGHEDGTPLVLLGNIHNNAWEGGSIAIHPGVTVYGNVTSAGDVDLASGPGGQPAVVYGNVWGSWVRLSDAAEIRDYDNLTEEQHGIDLNRDGDATDIGISRPPATVSATKGVEVAGRALANGASDRRILGGMRPVAVGTSSIGPTVDPRPDFTAYYELVTGTITYPPAGDHVATPIRGDGDGHYFVSAAKFIDWLRFRNESNVFCWRCAGDGWIDPLGGTACPDCSGTGSVRAVEVTGVFYVDDEVLDLSEFGQNLVVHGTIVVASGDPYRWPRKTVRIPGGHAAIDHFPEKGRFVISGPKRMHFTQTYRSDEEGGTYVWNKRTMFAGEDRQVIPLSEPGVDRAMHDFPALLAPKQIDVGSRAAGFAYHAGDIGDEALTVLQGVVYAEEDLSLHGRGGFSGETIVFDEETNRSADDALDESVLNIDLNGDGDIFDHVELNAITAVPVIPVAPRRYNVDIDNDGVLNTVTIGVDYSGFFERHGYRHPVLVYHQGLLLGQELHTCEGVLVNFDPGIAAAGIPFGFDVSFGGAPYQGLVSWREHKSP